MHARIGDFSYTDSGRRKASGRYDGPVISSSTLRVDWNLKRQGRGRVDLTAKDGSGIGK